MPALPHTADELLRDVERSGLLTREDLNRQIGGLPRPKEPALLARWLVRKEILTTFQADQLLKGKTKNFFFGKYRVLGQLGDGATSSVFLCEHVDMKTRVAVKALSEFWTHGDKAVVQRFRREAKAASLLDHPNVVRTFGLEEQDGRHFMVMEYVEGQTLDQWMQKHPHTPLATYVEFILQAVIGLQHIHESGLIHRDLKPANLLITKERVVKILDLGLARFTDDRHDDLSEIPGSKIIATVDFMSPELAGDRPDIDIRTDIYSLGATLYFLATRGQLPYPAASFGAKIMAIQMGHPKPVSELRRDIDPLLEKLIQRMMAKSPEKRFESPAEAITVLRGWLSRSVRQKAAPVEKPASMMDTQSSVRTQCLPVVQVFKPPEKPSEKKSARSALGSRLLKFGAFLLLLGALLLGLRPWESGRFASAQPTNGSK